MLPTFEEIMQVTEQISSAPAFENPDARGLYDCCKYVPSGGCVVEVGCQLGRSSSIIAQLGKYIGYHSIHIDPYTEQPECLKAWTKMMYRLSGAFALFCMRTEQAEWYLSHLDSINVAFIDGDHEKRAVEIDLRLLANKIVRGGFLAAHDYTHPGFGVKAALDEYIDISWHHVGVFGSLGVWLKK
jgi:hypothetical protein